MFDNGEDRVLKTYPKVLDKYKKELGESISDINTSSNSNSNSNSESLGAEREKALVRVRTMDNKPVVKNVDTRNSSDNFNYYGPGSDFNSYEFTSQKGTSFVLVIAAVLTLVFLVAVVTIGILKFINV